MKKNEAELRRVFSERLRKARLSRGWTQAITAEQADLALEVYGRLERGRMLPKLSTLISLRECLGVPFEELLGEIPLREAEPAETPQIMRILHMLKKCDGPMLNAINHLLMASGQSMRRKSAIVHAPSVRLASE